MPKLTVTENWNDRRTTLDVISKSFSHWHPDPTDPTVLVTTCTLLRGDVVTWSRRRDSVICTGKRESDLLGRTYRVDLDTLDAVRRPPSKLAPPVPARVRLPT